MSISQVVHGLCPILESTSIYGIPLSELWLYPLRTNLHTMHSLCLHWQPLEWMSVHYFIQWMIYVCTMLPLCTLIIKVNVLLQFFNHSCWCITGNSSKSSYIGHQRWFSHPCDSYITLIGPCSFCNNLFSHHYISIFKVKETYLTLLYILNPLFTCWLAPFLLFLSWLLGYS